jgi:acyl dehydratase
MTTPIATAEVGTTFTGQACDLSLDRILAFSGGFLSEPHWPHKNLHTDLDKAREAGLPDLIASGNQSIGILTSLLIEIFGMPWFSHGTLDLTVVKSVYANETVQAKAVVKERQTNDNATRVTLDAWCENQHGDTVVAGTATCRINPM